jgi:hypothetical protein
VASIGTSRLRPHWQQAAIASSRQRGGHDDAGHADFHRLLDDPVNLVRSGQRLDQRDAQARFALDRVEPDHVGLQRAGQARGKFAAAAVEQHDGVALPQAQHRMRVMRDRRGQLDLR